MENESFAYRLGGWSAAPGRVALYGFLLARQGVPFLPKHNLAALVVTLLAGLATSFPVSRNEKRAMNVSILVAAGVMVAFSIVTRMDAPTTSMVLIGAVVVAVARLADNVPMTWGLVAGVAAFGAVLQVTDATPPFAVKQAFLSGRPWTPDRAGHEALLLAGFIFLTAFSVIIRHQATQYKREKEAAEAARDAAVADERARIARELHDVVSHHVTAMTLQAEAAAMTGDKQALTSVASAGRDALTELRRMLGVLRHPDDGAPNALTPQPDLGALDGLAERASSGPAVRVERHGDVRSLSAGLELGVYRLVQEALTNAAKHGDATTVDVVLTYGDSELTVDVIDNGRPLAAARVGSGGLGLVGMQERIALLNGVLETGPRSDANGYRVHAVLPIDA